VIRLNPRNAIAYDNRGSTYAQKREYAKAIEDYTEAIRLDPKAPSVFYNRGIAYTKEEDYDKAIKDYTEALRLYPDLAAAYNNRALACHKKGEYDKAIADFTTSLRLEPKDAYALNNYAWLLATCREKSVRDDKKAVELATRSCRLTDWKDAGGLLALAAAHAENGNFKEAVRLERRAIELGYPDRAQTEKARQRLKLYEPGKPYRE
jgi:tetratricopeptide (TPR) repeat protein